MIFRTGLSRKEAMPSSSTTSARPATVAVCETRSSVIDSGAVTGGAHLSDEEGFDMSETQPIVQNLARPIRPSRLPKWRAHGLTTVLNTATGNVIDAGPDRDIVIASLNFCNGASVEELRQLRDARITPAAMLCKPDEAGS